MFPGMRRIAGKRVLTLMEVWPDANDVLFYPISLGDDEIFLERLNSNWTGSWKTVTLETVDRSDWTD